MKALFVAAAFCFLLLGGLLRGEQGSAPTTQPEEITQLRKQIETLEERVERLERCLDHKFRPRVVPLIGVRHPENSLENPLPRRGGAKGRINNPHQVVGHGAKSP